MIRDARGDRSERDAVRAANDPRAVTAALDAWFERAGTPERVVSLAIERIFYMPGVGFQRRVYASSWDAVARARRPAPLRRASATTTTPARCIAKAERKVAKGKFVVPHLGAPAYHLPELDLVLWTFPNDPKLKVLARRRRPRGGTRGTLGGLPDPGANGSHWELGAIEPDLVRYIPRKRCVFRCAIEWRRGARRRRFAARSARDDAAAGVRQGLRRRGDRRASPRRSSSAMWRAAQADERWLRIPAALRYDAQLQTV